MPGAPPSWPDPVAPHPHPAEALPWLRPALERALPLRAHAVLLHAPSGVGVLELARSLAQGWLCEAAPDDGSPRPCGRCAACHLVAQRTHADLMLLVPAALRGALGGDPESGEEGGSAEAEGGAKSKAKPSREVRVAEIREAIDWSHRTSARGRGKVLVIHPGEAMNAVAANALLKTLEEPPGALRIVMTCGDPELLLPTIRSRCQRQAVPLPPPDQAMAWLQTQGVARPQTLLAASGGRPLEALALVGEGLDATRWLQLPAALQRGDAGLLAGLDVRRVVDTLQKLCHDLMAVAVGAPPRYFEAAALPSGARLPPLVAWARTLARTARHDEHPWQAALLVQALVHEGAQAWATTGGVRGRAGTLPPR